MPLPATRSTGLRSEGVGVLVPPMRFACLVLLVATSSGAAQQAEWTAYGGDALGTRWSPLRQVNRENVASLKVAWSIRTGEADSAHATAAKTSFEATPILLDRAMYLSTPTGRVLSLEPETGRVRWTFDPRVDRSVEYGDFTSRGVSAWTDHRARPGAACARRIVLATIDGRLFALDARRGTPCAGFGHRGVVDLRRGLRNPPFEPAEHEVTSPPAVVNDVIVVGSAVADNSRTDAASGEVRGYDARTGKLRWSWDPIPQDRRDPAWASWEGGVAHRTGAANAWSVLAADPARDLVIVPTSSASPDYYGGARLGRNDYANSVVALRASSGKLVWHFQTVHHDLWDYDNASPPALVTLRRQGREVPAVVQATKTGMLFVLHRETGAPLFPVEERPVPASTVAGERAWPTQPFSSLPALSPQGRLSPDSLWGADAADSAACRAAVRGLRNEGIFTPPSREGSLVIPSNIGGAHWGGVAFDPGREIVVVPVNTLAAVVQLIPQQGAAPTLRDESNRMGYQLTRMRGTPYFMRRRLLLSPARVPCTPPPFGKLVAVSLRTGERLWDVPLGSPGALVPGSVIRPPGAPELGSPNLGGPIATAGGVVFIAATLDRHLRAFDIESGRELWRAPLPAGGKATPMTYRGKDGRQYVVIAAGGDGDVFGSGDAVVAFALPR